MQSSYQRLGRRIKAQRARKGYRSAVKFAEAAGLSVRTIEVIESGAHAGRPRDATFAKIEAALGWTDGSCEAILQGGRAKQVADPMLARVLRAWPNLYPDQQLTVVTLVENFTRQG